MEITEKQYKQGRLLYILEAALEYLISILVAGSYLATLTETLGFSDSLTGILSSVVSMGCLFQLFAIGARGKNVKKTVFFLSVGNQLLFTLLYIIPITPLSATLKGICFVVFFIVAYFLYNIAHPKKICWLMSLVDDRHRGRFTANKEIVSLLMGMGFTFLMGNLMDHFKSRGEIRIALILAAGIMLVLTLLHTATIALTVRVEEPRSQSSTLKQRFAALWNHKSLKRVLVVFCLYHMAEGISVPFYGTYVIHELGFSLTIASVVTICGSFSRILFSRLWGRWADRRSFAWMNEKCFVVLMVGHLVMSFTAPANGTVLYPIYTLLKGIAMGGINSSFINMVFDYARAEDRSDSLALCQAVTGIVHFGATLAVSPLITLIQKNGNRVLGLPLYAQQLFSFISVLALLAATLYLRFQFIRKEETDLCAKSS